MRRRGWILLALLGAGAAYFFLSRSGPSERTVGVEPGLAGAKGIERPSGSLARSPGPEAQSPPSPADRPTNAVAPRPAPTARTELPVVRADSYDGGLRTLASPAAAPGPIDRRPNAGPRAKQELEAIRYGLETLDEDVAACLDLWNQTGGRDAGEVMIGFEIDAHGLRKSWVESDVEVPFGPRTCLANAVYGIDWSHVVEQPVKITNRFDLMIRDGGA